VLADLRAALAEGNAERLWRVAHELKGTAGSVGAARLFATADALEQLGRSGELAGGEGLVQAIELDLPRVQEALRALAARRGAEAADGQ
jgi:HPt (histidine-containing phosphotransfer) domain-containing protein